MKYKQLLNNTQIGGTDDTDDKLKVSTIYITTKDKIIDQFNYLTDMIRFAYYTFLDIFPELNCGYYDDLSPLSSRHNRDLSKLTF